jgi:hypothetical protein
MSPKSNVLDASAKDHGKVFVHSSEGLGVASLPDVPDDCGADGGFFVGSAPR